MGDLSLDDQLLIEEYKSCRDLITKNIDIMEKNEVFVVGAVAAILAFSSRAEDSTVAIASACLPLIISLLGYIRFIGLDDTIDKINSHFMEMEKKHSAINWTTFYREHNKTKVLKKTRFWFWRVLFIVAIVFAIYMIISKLHISIQVVSGN